ncbi:conserved hypothetical protein [Lactobacillus acetotolerans]|uniref:UPF0122 protein LBAT_0670 n=1 Tax=Lactobacillus acetotolerans TaxID=1600 RepID=A0A0D6A2Y8_9LACO|nr:transcriptional regulator [Lactobacillus acetotolerans]BAQ57059.1 conserved hypothetical protein [Lactobacillus acetotolerans]
MDELEKNEKLGDLYAYYGTLLTKGQQAYFEDCYYNDYSLGEIAANHKVSRQAVYDNLRRSSRLLEKYEAKLHMQRDYNKIESELVQIYQYAGQNKIKQTRNSIKKLLNQMRGE